MADKLNRKTMKMRMALYFKKDEKGNFVADHPMTETFLLHGVTGLDKPGQLSPEEFEQLKEGAIENGFIIYLNDEKVAGE